MAIADSTSILSNVRSSCKELLQHDACSVHVNMDSIHTFLEELDWDKFDELAAPQRFPLNFRSQEDEVSFLTLLSLLNFGSGYRSDLHKYCQRGASDTILFGLIGLYISIPHLNAEWMRNVSIDVLANYFSIPMDRDEEISPGIYVSKPGPLRSFVEMLYKTIHTCGEKLQDVGYTNLGAFILAHLRKDEDASPSAVHLIEQLVTTFPVFEDHQLIRSIPCYFLKRAQLVVVSLYRRFSGEDPAFDFTDMEEITVLSDNVLPCVLRAMGILEYDASLASHIDRGELLPTGEWECEIRAGSIVACDAIIKASKGRLMPWTLDKYLWSIGKDSEFRQLQRHSTRDTMSY